MFDNAIRGLNNMRIVFAVSVVIGLLAPTVARADSINLGNIMPLGDSITAGYTPQGGVPGGYRQELFNNLVTAGYSFRFVGSQTTYPSSTLTESIPDQSHHEGHNAYTIQQIIDGMKNNPSWMNVNPDIILLHIGANDILNPNAATAPDRLDALLDVILAKMKPDAQIIVAKIMGGSIVSNDSRAMAYDSGIVAYNAAIAQKVAARNDPRVSMVDMYSLMNINHQTNAQGEQLFADISHPNQIGYNLMGDAWASAIKAYHIPEPGTLIILSTGVLGLLGYVWRRGRINVSRP